MYIQRVNTQGLQSTFHKKTVIFGRAIRGGFIILGSIIFIVFGRGAQHNSEGKTNNPANEVNAKMIDGLNEAGGCMTSVVVSSATWSNMQGQDPSVPILLQITGAHFTNPSESQLQSAYVEYAGGY